MDVMNAQGSGRMAAATGARAEGSARPARAITSEGSAPLQGDGRVSLRKANANDRELIWEWTFSSDLRALMRPMRVVLYKDYERWLFLRLADRQTPLWVIEEAGARSGVVLIDRHDKQALPRLSMVVSPRQRGRGLGRHALALLCAQWQHPLIAEAFADNLAAVRSLEAAGFGRANERRHDGKVICTYLWSP